MPDSTYEEQLKAASEAVYSHSLELTRLKKELERINEQQETLMHFIGHEVKGFLARDSAVFAALSEGDFGQLSETMKPVILHALEQSRDGALSVTNILTASNQKKGTIIYTKEPFDLKALVAEAVEKAKSMAEDKGLVLSFSADDSGDPFTFSGDKEKIDNNVFRNIIENAIHYTPSGSITVTLNKEADKFVFTIKDTGMGIDEEDKKHLFTEGGHGRDSQQINIHSTGYGLFIAKQVTEAHGGSIRAVSDGVGKGATFIVEFPV